MVNFKILLLIIFGLTLSDCNTKIQKSKLSFEKRRELAIKKNNAGTELFQQYLLLDDSDSLFYQALDSLNRAIRYDSTYARAYQNKAAILAEIDSVEKAISVLHQLIKKDSTQIMAITLQGFFYEQVGDTLSAQTKYNKAISLYELRIKNNPDNIFAKSERAFLFLFTHSKEKALKEINKVIQEHSKNKLAKEYRKNIQTFDRKRFIQSQ